MRLANQRGYRFVTIAKVLFVKQRQVCASGHLASHRNANGRSCLGLYRNPSMSSR